MKMVLASKSAHKLVEMKDILSQLGVDVVLESDVGVDDSLGVNPVSAARFLFH